MDMHDEPLDIQYMLINNDYRLDGRVIKYGDVDDESGVVIPGLNKDPAMNPDLHRHRDSGHADENVPFALTYNAFEFDIPGVPEKPVLAGGHPVVDERHQNN